MTVADLRVQPGTGRTGRAGLRLVWLHLESRRIPAAVIALAAGAAVLRIALTWHWGPPTGSAALQVPVLLEAGTAVVIAVTSHSPFGEVERATGRWLPWLRLGTALTLTGAAIGLLAAGAAGRGLTGGVLGMARDVAGMTGVGLLSAAVLGGLLGWIGPMTYLVVSEVALVQGWTSPWAWAARPAPDRGAAICAGLVLAAGLAVIARWGPRDSASG
jgi:hypothetical protein